ncbi:MAG: phenylalanine--tRNA ligase subunit alpha [Gemmatimonadetes bacterium]|nr:phenylalanine--tRNA ligase subunit alpha [Gemmatimonadota bacterium]
MSDTDLIGALRVLEREALAAVSGATDEAALETVRVTYLGRTEGSISKVLRGLGALPTGARPAVGQEANRVKIAVSEALKVRGLALAPQTRGSAEDLTLPSRGPWRGGLHPITQAVDEIWHIFRDMGFARARGPEADTEWYNFEALNTPLDHPAADEQDTLYLVDSVLLRSHTSPVQVRTMEAYEPPIRIIAPGWVYRRDTYDATHTPAFMQIEGLVVDEGVSFVDFKATLAEFARRYWGPDTRVRFRPSFFPFTEPSAEVDVKRVITKPDGTRVETDWLEVMGAGMVDPAVLENVGYDSERYTGWAFGMGPARIAMLKHGVDDLRTFFENDMRFLAQFSS